MGIASLILGIISIVTVFLSLTASIDFGSLSTMCAIVGLILGIMQNKTEKDIKATIGIILCILYIIIFVVLLICSITAMQSR